jgi:predicted RNase H-like HicB family nuclease
MKKNFTMEYWRDGKWYVGRLKGVPGVFSQGITIEELEDNINEAYKLMLEEEEVPPPAETRTKKVLIEI